MPRLLGRALALVCMLVLVPAAAASAASTATLSMSSTAVGCQPKGLWAIPANKPGGGGGLTTGPYAYKVTATVASSEAAPCYAAPVTPANGSDAALLQFNQTPGDAASITYNVYRSTAGGPFELVFTFPGTATAAQTSGVANCTAGARFCTFFDPGLPQQPSKTAPAGPAAQSTAASHPDVNIVQAITPGADVSANPDTLKTDVLHFAPGFLANPTAAAACALADPNGPSLLGDASKQADANEDTCSQASLVGTIQVAGRVLTQNGAANTLTEGDIYIGAPKAGEAGRLLVALRPPCSTGSPVAPGSAPCTALLGSPQARTAKQFLAAAASFVRRSDGSYGLDIATYNVSDGTDQPLSNSLDILAPDGQGGFTVAGHAPIQIRTIVQHLFGIADQNTASTSDDQPFTVMPTSCGDEPFSADKTFYTEDGTVTASTTLASTDCALLGFSPAITATVGGAGKTAKGQNPDLDVTITQPAGDAATKSASTTIPNSVGPNLAALGTLCTDAQADSDSCPAGSQVGTASAASRLLPGTLAGNVYVVGQSGGQLPKLAVLLKGAINLRIDGQLSLGSDGATTTTFAALPDVPLSTFTLHIRGLVTNNKDLCDGAGNVTGHFVGYNGKTADVSAPLTVVGAPACPVVTPAKVTLKKPKLKVTLAKVKTGRPTLKITATRANGASRMRNLYVVLPKGLSMGKGKGRIQRLLVVKAGSKRLKLGSLRVGSRSVLVRRGIVGAKTVTITFKRGLVHVKKASIRKKGKHQRLTFRFRTIVGGGKGAKPYGLTKVFKPILKVRPKS